MIYVKSVTALLNENKIRTNLKKLGINKFKFSDYYRIRDNSKCSCRSWNIEKDDLLIGFYEPFFIDTPYTRLKNVFFYLRYGYLEIADHYGDGDILGICLRHDTERYKQVLVFPGKCASEGENIFGILQHELLHIRYKEHCLDKKCLFNFDAGNNKNLCKHCRVNLKEIIKGLNNSEVKNG